MRTRDKALVAACAVVLAGASIFIARELFPSLSFPAQDAQAVHLTRPDGLSAYVYAPRGLDPSRKHPLVMGFSPSGHGAELVGPWRKACDRFGWILVGSDNFKNGSWSDTDASLQAETLALVKARYPVDETHIYATGLSGGAMHAHDVVADHPEVYRGAIVNTGMMPFHWPGNAPLDRAHYPRGKLAVLLASPTDFRFHEMQQDKEILEGLGWRVLWIEGQEGHAYASADDYVRAAEWLEAQP